MNTPDITIESLYDLDQTIAKELLASVTYPWRLCL